VARRGRHTSSVARSQLPRRSLRQGGQFVLHAKGAGTVTHMMAIHSAPSSPISKAHRCYGPPHPRRQGLSRPQPSGPVQVWITGQVRRVTKALRREMRRRAAIEPVIGHLKGDHRMGRNYLKARDGDRINAVLAAAATTSACSFAGSRSFYAALSLILCHALLAPRLI